MEFAAPFAGHGAVSAALIAATTFVHALFISTAAVFMRGKSGRLWGPLRFLRDSAVLVVLTLWLMIAHAIEIAIWAVAYVRLDLLADIERAYYFAAVCFTTLGFGDVLLPEGWGLLAGANAANGFLLFGMSAAFLVEAVLKLRMTAPGGG